MSAAAVFSSGLDFRYILESLRGGSRAEWVLTTTYWLTVVVSCCCSAQSNGACGWCRACGRLRFCTIASASRYTSGLRKEHILPGHSFREEMNAERLQRDVRTVGKGVTSLASVLRDGQHRRA